MGHRGGRCICYSSSVTYSTARGAYLRHIPAANFLLNLFIVSLIGCPEGAYQLFCTAVNNTTARSMADLDIEHYQVLCSGAMSNRRANLRIF